MKRTGMLKGVDISLEDDYIIREKQVQEWLEKRMTQERRLGHETKLGYQQFMVDGLWDRWDNKEGRLKQMEIKEGKRQAGILREQGELKRLKTIYMDLAYLYCKQPGWKQGKEGFRKIE